MKAKLLALYAEFEAVVNWCHREFRETADNLMRDMRSMKSLFNYLYLALYLFLCVWAALYHAKDSLNTAIVTTGGIVPLIFGAYVWGSTKEKQIAAAKPAPLAAPEKGSDDEEGAAD